ncbi:8946_t:CDS:2 [Cetraspora pellucida]|uniref:8946_t:CDS:1 n=1 Tax=Cetraspora pellucida TaxID=1433469 RepID=A0A9N9A7N1_9GLOM|nr:8946_t:CDS:2 [Cetraspora pellucida]
MSKQLELKEFEGFEEHLDPNNLSLISILRFRRSKSDFTYSKLHEHALISKFLACISEIPEWSEAALSLKKNGVIGKKLDFIVETTTKLPNLACGSYGCFPVGFILSLHEVTKLFLLLFSVKQQTQNEEVIIFWFEVDNEIADLKIKRSENQFVIDRSDSNNQAHNLIEERKLALISKLGSDHSFKNNENFPILCVAYSNPDPCIFAGLTGSHH